MDAPRPDVALDYATPDLLHGQSLASMASSVERINTAAGGIVQLPVARFQDLPGWTDRLMRGDPQAVAVMQSLAYVAQRIAVAAPGHHPECAGCGAPITGGTFSCVVATAEGLVDGIAATVCGTCGPLGATHDELRRMALPTLRAAFPGLRLLPPIHPTAGHA